jgi:hypothetical protein
MGGSCEHGNELMNFIEDILSFSSRTLLHADSQL